MDSTQTTDKCHRCKTRVPLTDEEIYKMYNALWRAGSTEAVAFARAIERAHEIGDNT